MKRISLASEALKCSTPSAESASTIITPLAPRTYSIPINPSKWIVRRVAIEIKKALKGLNYIGVAQISGVINSHSDLGALPRFAMAESFAHMEGFTLKINTLPLAIESVFPTEPLVT